MNRYEKVEEITFLYCGTRRNCDLAIGFWAQARHKFSLMQKALFLDRDGVIIHDAGYLRDPSQVQLIPGVDQLISRFQKQGFQIVVVTNQSGIGRGWISLDNYKHVSLRMIELLQAQEVALDVIYFAPFFAEAKECPYQASEFNFETLGVAQRGSWRDDFRKPQPGMLKQASQDQKIDLAKSIMIGDRATDWRAAAQAGLAKFYFRASDLIEKEKQELIKIQKDKMGSHPALTEIVFFTDFSEIELK